MDEMVFREHTKVFHPRYKCAAVVISIVAIGSLCPAPFASLLSLSIRLRRNAVFLDIACSISRLLCARLFHEKTSRDANTKALISPDIARALNRAPTD